MEWDPFGDLDTRGILRNKAGTKNPDVLKDLERVSIISNMPKALDALSREEAVNLNSWKRTHAILFGKVYPWAGRIRDLDVQRGPVLFNTVRLIEKEANIVFEKANSSEFLIENRGYVYGELAFNHPFLDGNGRSLNTIFSEMARRAGFGIQWDKVDKREYLRHLTIAIRLTEYKDLDEYLRSVSCPAEELNVTQHRLLSSQPN